MMAAGSAIGQSNLGMQGPAGWPSVPKGHQMTTYGIDPASQAWIDQQRGQAQAGADVALNGGPYFTGPQTASIGEQVSPFMNPFMDQVMGGLNTQYDHLRNQALTRTSQQATQSGAYGGSRAALLAGARMGELDRAQMQQTGDLLYSGYNNALQTGLGYAEQQRQLQQQRMQEPLWRQQQAMGFMGQGPGPTGGYQIMPNQGPSGMGKAGNAAKGFLGGAATGASIGSIVPGLGTAAGAIIGGGLGLFGGLF